MSKLKRIINNEGLREAGLLLRYAFETIGFLALVVAGVWFVVESIWYMTST